MQTIVLTWPDLLICVHKQSLRHMLLATEEQANRPKEQGKMNNFIAAVKQ